MTITMRRCEMEDIHVLQEISYVTFDETFKDQNSPENMKTYLERAFNLNQLKRELSNPFSSFYFIFYHNELSGYLKINSDDAQSEEMGSDALEVERIYIKRKFQKHGLGKYLLNEALKMAKEKQKSKVWLGV